MSLLGRKRALAVDIGTTAVRAAELERGASGLRLTLFEELQAPCLPQNERVQFLAQEGKEFLKRLPTRQTVMSLPGRGILVRTLTVPNVPPKKLKDILKYEVQQQIPFPLEVVSWKYQTLRQTPQNIDIFLGAVKKDLISESIAGFSPFGLEISFLDTDFFALMNIFRASPRFKQDACQAILDLGAASANLIIIQGEKILMRSLTTSGDSMTNAIVETEGLSYEDAEKRKIAEGMQIPAIASSVDALHTEIQNSIDYWRFTQKGPEVDEFFLTGGSSLLAGFREYVEEHSRVKTAFFDPLEFIEVPADLASLRGRGVSLSTCLGLALRGTRDTFINLDFLPAEVVRMREFAANLPYIYLSCVLALAIALTPLFFISMDRQTLKALQQDVETEKQQYEKHKPEVERLRAEISRLQANAQAVRKVVDDKSVWLSRILNMGACLPSSRIYITGLTPGESAAPAATPAAPVSPVPPGPEQGPVPEQPTVPSGGISTERPSAMTLTGEAVVADVRGSFDDFKKFVERLKGLDFLSAVDISVCEMDRAANRLVFTLILRFK